MDTTEIETQEIPQVSNELYFIIQAENQVNWQYHSEANYGAAIEAIRCDARVSNCRRVLHGEDIIRIAQMATSIHGVHVQLMVMYTGEDIQAAFDVAVDHIAAVLAM